MADSQPLLDDSSQAANEQDHEEEEPPRCSRKVVMGLAAVVLLVACITYLGKEHWAAIVHLWRNFLQWCKLLGWKASFLIAIATWISTSVGMPVTVLFLGSGAVFANLYGPTMGAAVAILSCGVGFWAGCITAFLLGRHLLKPMVQRQLDSLEAMRAVNLIVEEEGWKFAFLMRLSPFLPVEVFNFASAMTTLSFRENALACLGSLPTASFEIWMYSQVAHAVKGPRDGKGMDSHYRLLILIAVNLPIFLMLFVLVRHAHQRYHEKVDVSPNSEQKDLLKNPGDLRRTFRKACCPRHRLAPPLSPHGQPARIRSMSSP